LDGYSLLDEHLDRLGHSAEYFGFPLSRDAIRGRLEDLSGTLPPAAHKVRLLVDRAGGVQCEAAALANDPCSKPVRLELASRPVDAADPFLYHKTTHRDVYEAARGGCNASDDVLLYNQQGEITETCIANVVVRIGGTLWTPPEECGLLAGTFRERLLAEGKVRPRKIRLEEFEQAEEIFVVNSVRGRRPATLVNRERARSIGRELRAKVP
jgi:para-aminobenzoate synthetase/4-amino-4-deoxychorismate lyase